MKDTGQPLPADLVFVHEQVKGRYDFENKLSDSLETSASNLVGWNGLIISVLLTGGGLLLTRGQEIKLNMLEWSLLSGALVSLGSSLLIAILSFRWGGSYLVIPEATELIELVKNTDPSTMLQRMIATLDYAIVNNSGRNRLKKNLLSTSQTLFLASMVIAIIFLIEQSYKLIGNNV